MPKTNHDAERAILCAAIRSGGKRRAILDLESADFTDPRNRTIARVVRDMIRRDHPIDPLAVLAELEATGKLTTPGGAGGSLYVLEVVDAPDSLAAEWYAGQLRAATRVRSVAAAAHTLAQRCESDEAAASLHDMLREHSRLLEAIPGELHNPDTDDSRDTVGAILAEQDEETDWITPGWLARAERAVIVAAEGVAKTTLLRQFAVCLAGGLNPWTGQRVADGARVLFVDAENSRAQSRRAYRWIAGRCVKPGIAEGWKERIVHKTRNDGVSLTGADEQWFRDLADRVSPDVIVLSPAYKLMRGDPKEDRDVQDLLDVIDRVRVAHNAAVIIETHAPHGTAMGRDMRPYGSSVWLRWPEVGIGFRRDSEINEAKSGRPQYLEAVDWRGAREPRDWPRNICYGPNDGLPWVPSYDWAPSVATDYRDAA